MPLIPGKSKKAFSKNVEIEMNAGKPQKQALAIAYSVKRKKKASGGSVASGSKDMNYADGGRTMKQGAQEARKYDEQKQEKGVHAPMRPYPNSKESMGESRAGYYGKAQSGQEASFAGKTAKGKSPKHIDRQGMQDASKEEHRKVLNESRSMPKPKLKGLAEGGRVDADSQDMEEVSRNRGNKASKDDSWSSNITIKQAQKPSITKLSQPKMVGSDVFSVRNRDMHEDEADMMDRLPPESDQAQPVKRDDEQDAKKMGKNPDMAAQHDNQKPPYNKAIEDQYAQDVAAAEMKKTQSYAQGGPVMQPKDHGDELMERDDEAHLESMEAPSEDEGHADAMSLDEEDQMGHNSGRIDMEHEHSNGRKPYARGGEISPEDEIEEERHNSIAAAIMARRDRMHDEIDSGAHDLDHAVKMAEGGEVDLSQNADEEPNHEDQESFEALKKENYSESAGLAKLDQPRDSNEHGDSEEEDSENKHDMISSIRSKMNRHRQFSK